MLKNKSWIVWISPTTVDLPGNGCGNDLYYKVPVQVINSGINPIVYILVFEMYRSCVVYFNDKELKKIIFLFNFAVFFTTVRQY